MSYDVILIHPPAIYDFRKKPLFPGALGSSIESVQFIKVAIGILSIADYLDRHGYKVIVDNIGDRMVNNKYFDVEEHIKNSQASIFAIGLHWHHHAQGAIEIAKLCKRLHPDSPVILGGITATYFHEEIIKRYDFVDAVIRGEGEKPMLEFVKTIQNHGNLAEVPNLTYRMKDTGEIIVNPLMPANVSLDEFEFTRFDLLEPKTSVFAPDIEPRGNLVVCRGCVHTCATCGGSAYSYKKYFGMNCPAFRSPDKIIEDIRKLSKQGIRFIGLYQDPRMGGEKYWKELMAALRSEKFDIERLSIDIFFPVDEEFAKEISTIGITVVLYICPDTGDDCVRNVQGRQYSTEDLLNSVKICHKYHIPIQFFFSVGLAGETKETILETWKLWDKVSSMDMRAITSGGFGRGIEHRIPLGGPIVGPIILEPGALAYDFPEKYGYKLLYKNLEEYIEALSMPSWHQWLNHETKNLNKESLIEIIMENVEYSIDEREKYGIYDQSQSDLLRFRLHMDIMAVREVNQIMTIADENERELRLNSLRDAIDSGLDFSKDADDPYNYRKMIKEILFNL
jgi:B12-binding domain/radical SAM domain protein